MKTLVTRRQALAAASALTLAPFAAGAAEREKVGMQLILAADVSGSVNASRYKTQQDGYLEALGDPRVMDVVRDLDPPVLENFSNAGNSGDFSFGYDREISDNDRFRVFLSRSALRYSVPNDLIQQNQQLGPQRQDANSEETSGQIYFQHSISPTLFLSLSGSVRDSNFILHSNDLSTPVIVNQNRGYREGYVRGDFAGHFIQVRTDHLWRDPANRRAAG